MYLDRVVLEHIRGFTQLDFSLTRPDGSYADWTVFTGDSGSGKSTLLKAIAVGLTGRHTARALQPSFNRWVRHGAPESEGAIQLEIVRVAEDDELANQGTRPSRPFSAPQPQEWRQRDHAPGCASGGEAQNLPDPRAHHLDAQRGGLVLLWLRAIKRLLRYS